MIIGNDQVTDVIIHGLDVRHCQKPSPGQVVMPGSKILQLSGFGVDAIAIIKSSKFWIDHKTLYQCKEWLVDVMQWSIDVTIPKT